MAPDDIPLVPTAWGDLIDRITILEIKCARLADAVARDNAARELALLTGLAGHRLESCGADIARLRAVNRQLWEIEDAIRDHERRAAFDDAFIALARAVYRTNDERARIKRAINVATHSAIVEEKSYTRY
jgi:hypothetical protein